MTFVGQLFGGDEEELPLLFLLYMNITDDLRIPMIWL